MINTHSGIDSVEAPARDQMNLFTPPSDGALERAIDAFDVDGSTPLDALNLIRRLKDRPR